MIKSGKIIVFSLMLTGLAAVYLIESCQVGTNHSAADHTKTSTKKALPDQIDFNFHIKPILSDRCFNCHGPDQNTREAGLALHTRLTALDPLGENKDRHAIVPFQVDSSTLLKRINASDPTEIMPPPESGLALSEYEKQLLHLWIEQGAQWKEHWAFIPPVSTTPPAVRNKDLVYNEIDHFILRKLEELNLQPSPMAPPAKLIRRASFSLTGLPPHSDDINDFINDPSIKSYENYLDKLLSSQAYAERMTSIWLDLARYSDTNGYQDDFERFNWPWRDWVIHAYHKNMPYDQFITWQLAGDLFNEATLEHLVATGFNRNHKITNEGGVIPEEYRVEYVADRTNTFGTAFLGMTMECARCHDHKYDPISQKNYFEIFSFFNNVPEKGYVPFGEKQEPTITITEKDIEETLTFINNLDREKQITYMVMQEMKPPRQAYILKRGSYDLPTTPVYPNTPEDILVFDGYQNNRMGLAQWLFSTNHPLTARVAVNRLWQQLFGQGIVNSSNDFGNQGSLPSHPELLDYLAIRYQEKNWNTKEMLKYIMMSATYRQSSAITPESIELDPDNIYLSYAPRLRLEAEMIRDHALAISGLLIDEVGGPSVKPYQPIGLWKETTGGGGGSTAQYIEDENEGLYRRSLYTFWKRTVPPPSMITFDAASRDLCTVKRQNTSTPLQALVMLNDPQILEAARIMAYNALVSKDLKSVKSRIEHMFFLATSRRPNDREIKHMLNYFKKELERFSSDASAVKEYTTIGKYQIDQDIEQTELAAYATIASLILNLDETINRG